MKLFHLLLIVAGTTHAADLSGKWSGTIELEKPRALTLTLNRKGQLVEGRIREGSSPMERPLRNGIIRDNVLTFDTVVGGRLVSFHLKVTSGKLEGHAGDGHQPARVTFEGPIVRFPQVLHRVPAEYTEEAIRLKNQGVVTMLVHVDATGKTTLKGVLRPLGNGLDEKAMEAVKKWRIKPASERGRPIAMDIQVEVEFRLP